jgi:hypothetical protein
MLSENDLTLKACASTGVGDNTIASLWADDWIGSFVFFPPFGNRGRP